MRKIGNTYSTSLISLVLVLLCASVSATTRYVAQTAGTFSGGSACNGQTAITVSTFNSTSLAAGDLTYICGTITASAGASNFIFPNNGGSSGNPIEILFDTGAVLTAPYWGVNGAIFIGNNYVIVDGGTNGLITATANGTALANQVSSTTGVMLSSSSNSIIRNLTVANLYVHTVDLADTADGTQNARAAIYVFNGSSDLVYNNTVHDTGTCIRLGYTSVSNFQAYNNTCYNINWGIIIGDNGASDTLTGLVAVYGNTIHDFVLWDQTDNFNHHDGIYYFATNGGSSGVGADIYNNYIYGDPGEYANAFIYTSNISAPSNTCGGNYIFNNLLINTAGTTNDTPANGVTQLWCASDFHYNNTMLGITQSSTNPENNSNPGLNTNIGTGTTIENDIIELFRNGTGLGSGSTTSAQDYNDYYNNAAVAWDSANNAYTTLSAWQACHTNGCPTGTHDTNSTLGNPLLTGTYHLTSASSAAWQTGVNLTSTCSGQPSPGLGALCSDKNGTARPATGPWDMGAYEDSAISQATAPTCTPTSGNAPQSLTCSNTNSAPTVMCEAISPVTPVTNGLGTGCTTGNSLGTGSSESFSVLIGATYEFVAGTSTLADSNPTSYTFSNCPAQYQAGTPGLPNYGGIRIDQCVANIGAIPNLWTNYSADHGFSGAGTSATNDFGNKICRITDGNSDPSQIGGTFTTNYSGSDVDQHIAVDGSMFTIGRDGASYSLLYIYNGIGCPQQVQTSPGVPYEIPTKITAFSQSASTPHLLHVMNITQGGPSPVTSVNSSGTYTGTIAAGSSNNLAGDYGIVSGFGAGGNIASPTLISASTNTSVTFSGVTTTPQSCPGTCILTVVSQAQIQNYDLSSCTVTACSPTITTVYDFAQGTELNWANGFQPSWSSVWRWSLDDTTSSIAFSNNQGAAGGQNTGTLVATYKVGSGARVMNTFPASIALTAVNGSGVYSCSCAGAVNNLFVNATMTVTGFSNSDNNVTSALITASSATSLTISATTTSETNSATAAFSVAGIPGETIVGDYGPTGSIAMTNCGGTPGSCSAPDGYNIHDMYQFGNSTANYIVGEKCLSGTGCTPGSTTLDQPYAWLIDSQNVLATNSSGHFGVGYNYIMHGTNSPQGQAGLFEVQSGGSLVSSPSSINLVSTSGPDNLPNPGAILLDIHCSWNENLGNDYYPVECGNTTVAINQAESPAHFANNGCDQHGYLQSPPNCLTTNLFTGPLVNELIIYPTAPIGGPTCTSAPCSTLPLLRLGNGYISAVSNDFSAANLIESIAPTGGYVLYSADHMGTLGSTSISVTSFTGTSGTLTFQAVNAFTAGNTITFGGFAGSNTGLNGQTVTVLSAGLSGSQFEATVSGAGYSSGRGQIVDPPPYILGGLTWQGGATAGSHAYNGGDVITPLDSNAPNCTYHALAAGNSSGSTEPTWVSGGLCITSNITDNTVTWVYDGMQNMRGDVFMVKTGIANVVIPPNNFLLLGSIYANRLFDGGY